MLPLFLGSVRCPQSDNRMDSSPGKTQILPQRGRVVELEYLGGMGLKRKFEVLGISQAKLIRE